MINIVIVDDQETILESFSRFLQADNPDFKIIGRASNLLQALQALSKELPDVLLTDLCFKNKNEGGLALIKEVKRLYPALNILAMTGYDDRLMFSEAQKLDAKGCFCKENNMAELAKAIRLVAEGKEYYSSQVKDFLDKNYQRTFLAPENNLSPKEKEALSLIKKSQKEMADLMCCSVKNVEKHISNLKIKTGYKNIQELTEYALRLGLLKA